MKDADPWAQIGVPWAFGSAVAGAMVPDNTEWNNTVLGQDGNLIGFVDAHYYPFGFSGATGDSNPTDQQVLQALMSVPSDYQAIRSELDTYNPRAQVVVGETGVSNNETTTVCTPAGALFAAGDGDAVRACPRRVPRALQRSPLPPSPGPAAARDIGTGTRSDR
jgi:hypothetical protein